MAVFEAPPGYAQGVRAAALVALPEPLEGRRWDVARVRGGEGLRAVLGVEGLRERGARGEGGGGDGEVGGLEGGRGDAEGGGGFGVHHDRKSCLGK